MTPLYQHQALQRKKHFRYHLYKFGTLAHTFWTFSPFILRTFISITHTIFIVYRQYRNEQNMQILEQPKKIINNGNKFLINQSLRCNYVNKKMSPQISLQHNFTIIKVLQMNRQDMKRPNEGVIRYSPKSRLFTKSIFKNP